MPFYWWWRGKSKWIEQCFFPLKFEKQDFSEERRQALDKVSVDPGCRILIDPHRSQSVLKDIVRKKSPWSDGISALLLRACTDEIPRTWCPIFQQSVEQHHPPDFKAFRRHAQISFVDLSSAFNTLQPHRLIVKLKQMNPFFKITGIFLFQPTEVNRVALVPQFCSHATVMNTHTYCLFMCYMLLHVITHINKCTHTIKVYCIMTNMLIYLCPTKANSDQLEMKSCYIHLFSVIQMLNKIFKMLSQQSLYAQSQQKSLLDCWWWRTCSAVPCDLMTVGM